MNAMTLEITVLPELQAYIDPLTPEEEEALERSLLAEGCRDALVLWGNVLVDGHNRYRLCQKHGLAFQTVQNTRFHQLEDVHLWMIDQHLGRRSLSQFQRGVLALRKREIIANRRAGAAVAVQAAQSNRPHHEAPWEGESDPAVAQALASVPQVPDDVLDTREALARAARLSANQVKMIETIHQHAAPEVVAAVKSGDLSLGAAAVVATLPTAEQKNAAAGGVQELKQAAKRVREAKKKAPKNTARALDTQDDAAAPPATDPAALALRITELEAENHSLRQQVKALQELLAEQG